MIRTFYITWEDDKEQIIAEDCCAYNEEACIDLEKTFLRWLYRMNNGDVCRLEVSKFDGKTTKIDECISMPYSYEMRNIIESIAFDFFHRF